MVLRILTPTYHFNLLNIVMTIHDTHEISIAGVAIAHIAQSKVSNHKRIGLHNISIFLVLMLTLAGCAPSPKPTIQAIVDSFFSGYAFLDVNGNGELDSEDTPLENAAFIVTLQFGGEVGAFTDKTGYAFIVAPGGVDYPVKMRMQPPKDSTLKLIGPSEITHELADESPKFLFSSK